jgi:hypothetical protein
VESESGDEGRKHHEGGDAESEEEASGIHVYKEDHGRYHEREQRKCLLRIRYAGGVV